MALLERLHWKNGELFDPPKNPLLEKWAEKYPKIPMSQYSQVCDGYSCMWCGRCPSGDHWEVPEEDKEVYDQWQQEHMNYINSHGGYENLFVEINIQDWLTCEVNNE